MMTEVWLKFWNWFSVKNWRLNFNQDFLAEVQARFWSWVFAKILGCSSVQILNFGQDLEAEVWSRPWRWSLIGISWLKFGQNCEAEFWPDLIWYDLKGGTLMVLQPQVHCAFVHVLSILNKYVLFHSFDMLLISGLLLLTASSTSLRCYTCSTTTTDRFSKVNPIR